MYTHINIYIYICHGRHRGAQLHEAFKNNDMIESR